MNTPEGGLTVDGEFREIERVIDAWRILQAAAAGGHRLPPMVRDAINVLDNADVMAFVDEAEARINSGE